MKKLPHGQWRNLCSTFAIHLADFSDVYHLECNIDGVTDFITHSKYFSFLIGQNHTHNSQ